MSKDSLKAKYPERYFEVMKIFHLTPDFKLSDYEKEIVKHIDKEGGITSYDLADAYDLRPSEVNEVVDDLLSQGVLREENGALYLTQPAFQYIHSSKEERKTQKKFKKFLSTLDEKDLNRLMKLVDSFEIKDSVPPLGEEPKEEKPVEASPEAVPAKPEEPKEAAPEPAAPKPVKSMAKSKLPLARRAVAKKPSSKAATTKKK